MIRPDPSRERTFARLQKAAAITCFVIAAGLLALTVLRPDAARAGLGAPSLGAPSAFADRSLSG